MLDRISVQRLLEVLVLAATQRAATHRERRASLLALAKGESDPSMRKKLLDLAGRYEQLAASVELSGNGRARSYRTAARSARSSRHL
jgi:hypothetical protein